MNKEKIDFIFDQFTKQNVLVIGDVMIDSYIFGKVDRISPEAPVPVVNVSRREHRLGGAANVALNLVALGAKVFMVSTVGEDKEAVLFNEMMVKEGIDCSGMVTDANKPTTVKTRVIGNNHQLIRVDAEVDEVSNKEVSLKLFEAVQHIIEHQKINVIVFEDYDKGAISELLITKTVALAQSKGIPVAVDPKKRNFNHYKNVDLFKPNLKEIIEGLKIEFGFDDFLNELKRTHQMLQKNINHKASLITLSERGMFWMDNEITHLEKARFRNISDVSGAGDTVIGVAALCLALGLKGDELTAIANIAGGLVCEYVGVVPIDRKQFYEEVVKCLAVN